MNKSIRLIACMTFVSTTFALTGCGNGGSKFVGTWDCGGSTTLTITHVGGDNYAAEASGIKVLSTYKNGALINSLGDITTIDQKTGELRGDGGSCKRK